MCDRMRIGSFEFSPSLWPTLMVLLLLPLFFSLSFWQLHRADQKAILSDLFEKRQYAAAVELNKENDLRVRQDQLLWRRIKAQGRFSKGINILLDNQVVNGIAGYFIYTPFHIEHKRDWILVNRGWIAVGDSRERIPNVSAPAEILIVSGNIKPPPRTGILLADNTVEQIDQRTFRVQKLVLDEIEEFTGVSLLPYVLRMSAESPAGFKRNWPPPGIGPERHRGYAFQWFMIGAVLLFIYLILNVKRIK